MKSGSMKYKLYYTLFLLLLVVFIFPSHAQTCCSGGVPLSNNIGGLPISPKGTWQFSLNADLNVLQTLKDGNETLDDNSRERKTISLLLKSSYSFSDKVFVEGLFTWVRQERTITQQGGFTDFDKTSGLGDMVIIANYQYLNRNGYKFIAGAGPKIPVGPSDLKRPDGLTLNADLQPGSGAWDGVLFHRIQKTSARKPSQNYYTNLTYRYTGVNNDYLGGQTYRFGKEFQAIAGIGDQVIVGKSLISVGLNARFRTVERDKFNDEFLPSTGGSWIFLMPLIGWQVNSKLMVNFNTELPLWADVDGTQLSPSFRINGGLFYTIQKKTVQKYIN